MAQTWQRAATDSPALDVLRRTAPRPLSGSRVGDRGADRLGELLPRISRPLLAWFRWYSRHAVARNFHALRLATDSSRPWERCTGPIVLYCNHASWWDPMVLVVFADLFMRNRSCYAPMDATALRKYRFFSRLGLFGVEQNTRRGAVEFLRTAEAILSREDSVLWITPQGRFADARERPVRFRSGLSHLAKRVQGTTFFPVALEYVFWEERRPEILMRVGPPMDNQAVSQEKLEQALQECQNELAAASITRDGGGFQTLLQGELGTSMAYDVWRKLKSWMQGQSFNPRHGTK